MFVIRGIMTIPGVWLVSAKILFMKSKMIRRCGVAFFLFQNQQSVDMITVVIKITRSQGSCQNITFFSLFFLWRLGASQVTVAVRNRSSMWVGFWSWCTPFVDVQITDVTEILNRDSFQEEPPKRSQIVFQHDARLICDVAK